MPNPDDDDGNADYDDTGTDARIALAVTMTTTRMTARVTMTVVEAAIRLAMDFFSCSSPMRLLKLLNKELYQALSLVCLTWVYFPPIATTQ